MSSDTGYSATTWEFDGEVTRVFDDMLERSIPQYDVMRRATTDVASAFVRHRSLICDLGCSRGEALAMVRDDLGTLDVSYLGCEVSDPMLAAAYERFDRAEDVTIVKHDLRSGYPRASNLRWSKPSVTLCVLTLMFVPINYRLQLLHEIAEETMSGGVLILVEKVLGSSGLIDDVMVANYHRGKTQNGYSPDDVNRKRLALEGVLVPLDAGTNERWLRNAGFAEVDCFWRWMNFAGWVAVKR